MNRYALESTESLGLGTLPIGEPAMIVLRSGVTLVGIVRRREGAELIIDGGVRLVDEPPAPKETEQEAADREARKRLPDGYRLPLANVGSVGRAGRLYTQITGTQPSRQVESPLAWVKTRSGW